MTNLLENTNKIQAVARTKQKQNQLADLRAEWTGQAETTILGITLTLERRRNSETEIKRIDKAKRRTKLLACLPLPWPNKLAVYKALVLPAVVYGWVCRKMPADDADHLHKALTRALHTNVMANSDIRKVVYGGTAHPLCHQTKAFPAPRTPEEAEVSHLDQSCLDQHQLAAQLPG